MKKSYKIRVVFFLLVVAGNSFAEQPQVPQRQVQVGEQGTNIKNLTEEQKKYYQQIMLEQREKMLQQHEKMLQLREMAQKQ